MYSSSRGRQIRVDRACTTHQALLAPDSVGSHAPRSVRTMQSTLIPDAAVLRCSAAIRNTSLIAPVAETKYTVPCARKKY